MAEPLRDVTLRSSGARLFGRFCGVARAPSAFVLLPGLGFHTFEYERVQSLLAREGLASLALDYRGHGRSDGRRGDWTLELLVDDARAAVDWVLAESSRSVVVLGNSLGAMVAVATANVEPRVAAVVASNCPARVGDFLMNRPRRALLALAEVVSRAYPLRVSVDHFYSYADLIDDPRLVERIAGDPAIRRARRLSVAAYRALVDWDGAREVAKLGKPLLLVQGTRDRLQPAQQTDALFAAAREPKARVCLDAGHVPTLERPDALVDEVLGWLTETSPRSIG